MRIPPRLFPGVSTPRVGRLEAARADGARSAAASTRAQASFFTQGAKIASETCTLKGSGAGGRPVFRWYLERAMSQPYNLPATAICPGCNNMVVLPAEPLYD